MYGIDTHTAQYSNHMPRIPNIADKFLYTKTDPNNVISGEKGALFFRRGNRFFLNADGNFDSHWVLLPYRTVIYPVPDDDKPIQYEHPFEIWEKNSNGHKNDLGVLMPKTDWKFYAYEDAFLSRKIKELHWIFPPPLHSTDPRGNNKFRSYDENFFYAKISGSWLRTPIHVYDSASLDSGDVQKWYDDLPFVDYPRRTPAPNRHDDGMIGDQSYDDNFFYVRPSLWKRTPLNYFDTSKMTKF